MVSNIGISITPEEETLIKVVPIPQGPIEWTWLNNTVSIISGNYYYKIIGTKRSSVKFLFAVIDTFAVSDTSYTALKRHSNALIHG